MAAPVISISSDLSDESVGSSFPQVLLISSIFVEVLVAPEVGAAVVASPAKVLELDTHSSLKMLDTEMSGEACIPKPYDAMLTRVEEQSCTSRSSSPTYYTPEIPTATLYHLHIVLSHHLLISYSLDDCTTEIRRRRAFLILTRGRTFPIGTTSTNHLDHFTSGSSSDHSSSDHSSSGHSTSDHSSSNHSSLDYSSSGHSTSSHSSSGHTPPVTTIVDSSAPSRFVYPPLARTLRYSEAYHH
ncbi:hypothetical protein Tco_0267888 [Tanacetum coccineum]